jgi:L-ribulose-5-phosphate 3-epimerase
MWKKKICLATSDSFGMSISDQIKTFARIGYDGFFTDWKANYPIQEWVHTAKDTGMIYQSIHAPFARSADMWNNDESSGKIALDELLACLKDCERWEIPIMVVHSFIGFQDHTPTPIGLERFGQLVKAAENSGVKIAFENTEGEEYLFALMEVFSDNPTVGFCWDSGHEMCYNHSQDLLARFGDRLIATHLNDNLGIRDYNGKITWIDDLHLLPFDGIADWDYNVERLNKCGYDGILTFELTTASKPDRHENDLYSKMELVDFLTEAFKRACRIAAKFNPGVTMDMRV